MTTSTAPDRRTADSVTALAQRLPADAGWDADDVIAAIESLGVGDHTARERYGMPSVFTLGEVVLAQLRYGRTGVRPHRGVRRAPSDRRYLAPALVRCALYLGPLSVAVAAADALHRVSWPVPVLTLLLGWSAAQALTSAGGAVARYAGPAPAARLVAGGFAAVAGFYGALVWVAPDAWVGPDRLLAAAVGLGGIASLATVTAALVTRAEAAVIRWSLPAWLLAATSVAAAVADGWAAATPVGLLLPAAIALPLVRAYRPMWGPPEPAEVRLAGPAARPGLATPDRAAADIGAPAGADPGSTAPGLTGSDRAALAGAAPGPTGSPGIEPPGGGTGAGRPAMARPSRAPLPGRSLLTTADLRRSLGYLVIGAAQAGCVALLWCTGPAAATPPAVLPLLAAVPLLEILVGWHTSRVDAALDGADSRAAFAERLRGVTLVTVAGLLPPLAVGVALAAAAYRLPYGLSVYDGARDLALALAGGTLLSGVFAATLLLAARGRAAAAAGLAAAPAVLAAVVPLLPAAVPGALRTGAAPNLLPTLVAILAVTQLVGLLAVAYTGLDHRRAS